MFNHSVSRRDFLTASVATTASVSAMTAVSTVLSPLATHASIAVPESRSIRYFAPEFSAANQPALPYADTALAPIISAATIGFHYGKHTKAYYDNLNRLIAGTSYEGLELEKIVRISARTPAHKSIFNNAAQAINHSFYFAGMKAAGGGVPPVELKTAIEKSFTDLAAFKAEILKSATDRFGSGWVWILLGFDGKLKIVSSGNADSPIVLRQGIPLLTIDVWEHAYYLDYQNLRAKFVTSTLDSLVDWNFANANLLRAAAQLGLSL